jgi:GH24 family phage-related lysozyme (muramidase)
MESIRDYIKKHEGYSNIIYEDIFGNLTCWYGHNMSVQQTEDIGEYILSKDIKKAIAGLFSIFGIDKFCTFPYGVKLALTDMIFNLGKSRFSKFKKMINAVLAEDWYGVTVEIKNSNYYKQLKSRADENIKQILENN